MTQKKHFDKKYFEDYYTHFVGNFTHSDLKRNKNWFYGWLKALQPFYDFENGDGKKVLEIGCAIGAAADILSENGFDVKATDISPYAVKKAKKLSPHIKFGILDIEKKTTSSKKYDAIISFEVVEHLKNPEKAIANMYKMLRPGGVVIFSTPYPLDYIYIDKTHINVRYPFEWVSTMRKTGFRYIKYKYCSFIPFFYKFSKFFHITLPWKFNNKFINSTVFFYGKR